MKNTLLYSVKNALLLIAFATILINVFGCKTARQSKFYKADNPNIQYIGRIDFSNAALPRFWSPGVYVQAKFIGTFCNIIVNDEQLYGSNQNYLEIAIDNNKPIRVQTKGKTDTIHAASGLADGEHTITICKNTESNIGYIEFEGIQCKRLLPFGNKPARKIEFIGNSITCGTGSDVSTVPCSIGKWQDQHNAYMAYGPVTARKLNAQWHLTAVSGIGLIHSCCGLKIRMPQVFDKVHLCTDSIQWSFDNYIPDVVTVCLGQNDGIQDSATFCKAYVDFIKTIRQHYKDASIICLTSPMADENLVAVMKNYLSGIVATTNNQGDKNVYKYFFSKRYNHGCDSHPDIEEHQQIAEELTAYIQQVKAW